jgi:DNA helicase-2/ATP-dependent DNA helicase PcrA
MIVLTDEQAVAAAAIDRLVNIVSAPGSGKTTVAAERFGYKRFLRGDVRGVLGLSFTRAASSEFASRVTSRWGSACLSFPHEVLTFDALFVRLLHVLMDANLVRWPNGHARVEVIDSYQGLKGYRWLTTASFRRFTAVDASRRVVSRSTRVLTPGLGIGNVAQHQEILNGGICSHEDVRQLLLYAVQQPEVQRHIAEWITTNFRELIIDEVYDAAPLDLYVAAVAAESGLGVTIIGDPRQALYGWRGATPEKVATLLESASEPFTSYQLPHSFRFVGGQMPDLARALRAGEPVSLPRLSSIDVDVALARQWRHLWPAGENVLPLAFRNVSNGTDAAINLLLDVMVRAHFGVNSYGREAAIIQLGLDREAVNLRQQAVIAPLVESLAEGVGVDVVLDQLRDAVRDLGALRRPNRLKPVTEAVRLEELTMLGQRMRQGRLIPGLTVHQAKGREWARVGVVLTEREGQLLANGLRELEDDDCVVYVALTRAKAVCGRLTDDLALTLSTDGS